MHWLAVRQGETPDVQISAAEHKAANTYGAEVSQRTHAANGRLRAAVREVRSKAFADFEAAVRNRDR